MEPRPFSRGNFPIPYIVTTHSHPFNGAATFQSRKLVWELLCVTCQSSSFNGAATFQSRKLDFRAVLESGVLVPSMEPRPFSRGNPSPSRWHSPPAPTFNGAATFQSRKPQKSKPEKPLSPILQWSRDLSVAETRQPPHQMLESLKPSMEPRPFSRGNSSTGRVDILSADGLQWSRDLSVAETAWSMIVAR